MASVWNFSDGAETTRSNNIVEDLRSACLLNSNWGEEDIENDSISFEIVPHKGNDDEEQNLEYEVTSNSVFAVHGEGELQFEIPIDISYDSPEISPGQADISLDIHLDETHFVSAQSSSLVKEFTDIHGEGSLSGGGSDSENHNFLASVQTEPVKMPELFLNPIEDGLIANLKVEGDTESATQEKRMKFGPEIMLAYGEAPVAGKRGRLSRNDHNRTERQRRSQLRELFNGLRDLDDELRGDVRISNIQILESGLANIRRLKSQQLEIISRKKTLMSKNEHLRSRNTKLKSEMESIQARENLKRSSTASTNGSSLDNACLAKGGINITVKAEENFNTSVKDKEPPLLSKWEAIAASGGRVPTAIRQLMDFNVRGGREQEPLAPRRASRGSLRLS